MRLSRSIVGQEEAKAVSRVLLEDGYLGMGSETKLFEEDLAAFLEVEREQVITTNSGTAALHLACDAIRACSRKTSGTPEILVPSLTFVASFQAISAAGCKPVACDVLANTGTLDLEDARARITENTIAVMFVDYASNPWHLHEVYNFAKENGLRVVEDAAHAFGCRHHGKRIGSFGDIVCFSFDGIKILPVVKVVVLSALTRKAPDLRQMPVCFRWKGIRRSVFPEVVPGMPMSNVRAGVTI